MDLSIRGYCTLYLKNVCFTLIKLAFMPRLQEACALKCA